jgi:hypothetical protein
MARFEVKSDRSKPWGYVIVDAQGEWDAESFTNYKSAKRRAKHLNELHAVPEVHEPTEAERLNARVAELEETLRHIVSAALRNNGPLARDHDHDQVTTIGYAAENALEG